MHEYIKPDDYEVQKLYFPCTALVIITNIQYCKMYYSFPLWFKRKERGDILLKNGYFIQTIQ